MKFSGHRTDLAKRPASPRGFTLLELLVVISIIAVLAVLVLPVTKSTMTQTRQMQSLSNMKTITSGLLAYAADNNMKIPSHDGNPEPPTWDASILPYLGFQYGEGYVSGPVTGGTPVSVLQLFRCPLDTRKPSGSFFPRSYAVSGIAINPAVGTPSQPTPFNGGKSGRVTGEGISLVDIRKPGGCVLLCRIPGIWEVSNNVVGERDKVACNGAPSQNPNDPQWKIFNGKTPYGFADGHVELCTLSQTLVLDPRFWTYDK